MTTTENSRADALTRTVCQACTETGAIHCADVERCGSMQYEWKDASGRWRTIDYREYEERLNFYKQADSLRITKIVPPVEQPAAAPIPKLKPPKYHVDVDGELVRGAAPPPADERAAFVPYYEGVEICQKCKATRAASANETGAEGATIEAATLLRQARNELCLVEWESDPPNRIQTLFDRIEAYVSRSPAMAAEAVASEHFMGTGARKQFDELMGENAELREKLAAQVAGVVAWWHDPSKIISDHEYQNGVADEIKSSYRPLGFLAAPQPAQADARDDTHKFKNFHRLLCERFGYVHDEIDWRRDQVSLIEWIAKKADAREGLTDEQIESAVAQLNGLLDACESGSTPDRKEARSAIHAFYRRALLAARPGQPEPIDMLLFCPKCGAQHIDAPEPHDPYRAADGSDDSARWTNPPHRSHLCHACGNIWRPADVPTNGVAAIATRGKADTWDGQPEPRAEVTLTAIDADMVWRDEDGESFHHSIDDAVDAEIEQSHPDTEPFEMKLTLAKRMPSATVRVFNITESGYEWEIVEAARAGASS